MQILRRHPPTHHTLKGWEPRSDFRAIPFNYVFGLLGILKSPHKCCWHSCQSCLNYCRVITLHSNWCLSSKIGILIIGIIFSKCPKNVPKCVLALSLYDLLCGDAGTDWSAWDGWWVGCRSQARSTEQHLACQTCWVVYRVWLHYSLFTNT